MYNLIGNSSFCLHPYSSHICVVDFAQLYPGLGGRGEVIETESPAPTDPSKSGAHAWVLGNILQIVY